jgi:hypothetical protein
MDQNTTHDASEDARPDVACSATLDRGRHTPGPWRYDDERCAIVADHATDQFGDTPVSVVSLYGAMGGDDTKADTALIAAAPELLEAAIYAAWRADPYSEAYFRLTAAVAKATSRDVAELRKALAKAAG